MIIVERVSGLEKRKYGFAYCDRDHAIELRCYSREVLPTTRSRKWAQVEFRESWQRRPETSLVGVVVPEDVTAEARETFIRTLRMLPVSA